MATKLAVLLFSLTLVGCSAPAEKSVGSTNKEVKVEMMARFDGIVLYRVDVGSRYVYVAAKDDGKTLAANWSEQRPCGKGCTRTEYFEVPTVSR